VALAPKTGMDAYQPLATTVVGGLIVGTILSLFDIPIMHTYVDDLIRWIHRTFLNREWHWPVTEVPDEEAERQEAPDTRLLQPIGADGEQGMVEVRASQ
jgi:hydrophobic/amphiphilic exporter-1 (mainly G- bacteria), HAE1 family